MHIPLSPSRFGEVLKNITALHIAIAMNKYATVSGSVVVKLSQFNTRVFFFFINGQILDEGSTRRYYEFYFEVKKITLGTYCFDLYWLRTGLLKTWRPVAHNNQK